MIDDNPNGMEYIRPLDSDDILRDKLGYTNPNLHRRLEPQPPKDGSGEVAPRDYQIAKIAMNSYRTVVFHYHDEDSTTSEIP